MTFTKRLRDGVRAGEITCSVRFWAKPRVIVGNRYEMEEGVCRILHRSWRWPQDFWGCWTC
jgi:hypothetical protein